MNYMAMLSILGVLQFSSYSHDPVLTEDTSVAVFEEETKEVQDETIIGTAKMVEVEFQAWDGVCVITDAERDMLAQLVMAEAGNQSLLGKRYVVDVVLNRVDSKKFPNTIKGVIYQKNQFSPIKDGGFARVAGKVTKDCYKAVDKELIERKNSKILFFSRGKSPYATHFFKCGDHWFGW